MCGITGIVTFTANNKLINSLPILSDTIKHRGPDDEGSVFFSPTTTLITYGKDTPSNVKNSQLPYSPTKPNTELTNNYTIGLSHRRLSVIDLSELGHQPMCDNSQRYWIVYNGEIYNFKELRDELKKLNHNFISQTDTEVLLHAHMQWGEGCVNKLNGMWSFVIYDKQENRLFASRDRFGVKPFYFVHTNEVFVFASEIKALLQLPDFKKELNPTAVYDYLILGKCESTKESLVKGIYELKPGHSLTLNIAKQELKEYRYYQLNHNTNWDKFSNKQFKTYAQETYNRLYNSIKLRLNADVKVGTCLSGGIDSSIVACVTNDILKSNQSNELQELFTAIYPSSEVNEENWAKMVANETQSNWNTTHPTSKDLQKQLEDIVYYQDIPFTSTSSFSQYKVMELVAKSDVKITLDGQGADELFGGYTPHFISSTFNNLKDLSFSGFLKNISSSQSNFANKGILFSWAIKHFLLKLSPKQFKQQLLKSQPELQYVNDSLWEQHADRIKNKSDDFNTNLNSLLASQFNGNTLKHILRLADRNAMRFSIESRMPFADDVDLAEFVFNISGSYKIRNGISKYLLREAFKQIVPEKIINRSDKIGFATPQKDWFTELKPHFKLMVFEFKNDEYIDWEKIKSNFDEIYDNAINTDTQRLWRLINFALWRKIYQV